MLKRTLKKSVAAALTYGSVCSGIEAASVAWEPLGWKPLWLSEIEPFPCGALGHHYPHVPNLGDFTKIRDGVSAGTVEAPDILVGGTPCQAFSVAGLRASMGDARGQLTLEFVRLADAIDESRAQAGKSPCTIVWENVPGVLSTKDNAFGCFLGALAGEDVALIPPGGRWANSGEVLGPQRSIAWRILDAQYFGVAQRRRRVFVVASAGTVCPSAILFEREGVRRDSPPSREAGKGSTHDVAPCLTSGGRGVERTGETRGQDPVVACFGGNNTAGPIDVSTALNACASASGRMDFESETFVAFDTTQNTSKSNRSNPRPGDPCHPLAAGAHPPAICATGDVFHTLRAEGFDASEDGTGRGGGAIAFHYNAQSAQLPTTTTDTSKTAPLTCSQGAAVAFEPGVLRRCGGHHYEDVCGTLRKEPGDNAAAAAYKAPSGAYQVRRLTPTECERLQGFPDGYTAIPWRGKPAELCPDGPRYKALGNSMAVTVMRWIGQRIAESLRGA